MEIKDRLALKVSEAVAATSISRAVLYEAMQRGDLPFVKLGTSRLIMREDLEAFLQRHKVEAEAA